MKFFLQASYATGQNATATLVYQQQPQTMTTQQQNRSPVSGRG